tara:strand:- start:20046 stop:20417 length:372 start_codon:yes stop_codon:yes gene_type:complete
MKLFVYGTLKEGYALNYVLSKSKKIGTYITKRKGFMMTGFWFPLVWEKKDSQYKIKGELYEVNPDDLRNANRIELGAGYEFKEIDKGVFGYIYPKKKDLKSLNIITNKKEKYYEWREYDDFPK